MNCKICNKEIIDLEVIQHLEHGDDGIKKCISSTHETIILLNRQLKMELEIIKIPISTSSYPGFVGKTIYYAFEFYYVHNQTVITKNVKSLTSTTSTPLFSQKGVMELDFSNISKLIKKTEIMETFS